MPNPGNAGKIRYSLKNFRHIFGIKEDWNILNIQVIQDTKQEGSIMVTFQGSDFPSVDDLNVGPIPEVTATRSLDKKEIWNIQKV